MITCGESFAHSGRAMKEKDLALALSLDEITRPMAGGPVRVLLFREPAR